MGLELERWESAQSLPQSLPLIASASSDEVETSLLPLCLALKLWDRYFHHSIIPQPPLAPICIVLLQINNAILKISHNKQRYCACAFYDSLLAWVSPCRLVAAKHQAAEQKSRHLHMPPPAKLQDHKILWHPRKGATEQQRPVRREKTRNLSTYAACRLYLLEAKSGFHKAHSSWLGRDRQTGKRGQGGTRHLPTFLSLPDL